MASERVALTSFVILTTVFTFGHQASADVVGEIFARLDTNGDGVITRTEFEINSIEVFYINDKNENIKLEASETRLSKEAFEAADTDGDGALSGVEFLQAPFTQFEAADTNTDQKITKREFELFIGQFGVD